MKKFFYLLILCFIVILFVVAVIFFDILNKKNAEIDSLKQQISLISKHSSLDKEIQECMQKANYTTAGMSDCVNQKSIYYGKEISKNVKLLDQKLPKDIIFLLNDSQNKWIEYKKADLLFEQRILELQYGSMNNNLYSGDRFKLLQRRAEDLSAFVFFLE